MSISSIKMSSVVQPMKRLNLSNYNNVNFITRNKGGIRGIHVVRSIEEVRKYRSKMGPNKLGFVPTMGALHDGHISLVKRASHECDVVAASIFVNPSQFSAGEDLDKYPRTFEADLELLKAAGVKFVFAPLTTEIYKENPLCHVEAKDFSFIDEGLARPDFFRGVGTIVCKLFNIIQPNIAYFGQKDISQCILIKRMVSDLNMPVEVRVCETVREDHGLAMSSRNTYLRSTERAKANILYKALYEGKMYCENNKDINRNELKNIITNTLKSENLVSKVEYISIASHINMKELDTISLEKGMIISSAIRLGTVRLIDNLLVGKAEKDILEVW